MLSAQLIDTAGVEQIDDLCNVIYELCICLLSNAGLRIYIHAKIERRIFAVFAVFAVSVYGLSFVCFICLTDFDEHGFEKITCFAIPFTAQ